MTSKRANAGENSYGMDEVKNGPRADYVNDERGPGKFVKTNEEICWIENR